MIIKKFTNSKYALGLEFLLLFGLLFFVLKQYLHYDVVADPDPEGYVSYANYLMENWSLPAEHRRLPGYPLFLVLVDAIGPYGMLLDAYWAQFVLTGLLVTAMWWFVRKSYGAWAGLVFVSMFAVANNFFIYFSTVAMSDLLRQVFLTIHFFLIIRYFDSRTPVLGYRFVALFAINGALTYLIHPGSQGIIYLFVFFLVAGTWVFGVIKQKMVDYDFNNALIIKALIATAAFAMTVAVCKQVADRGSESFYENWSGWRIAMCLPSADHSELAEKIEFAKSEISQRIGYPIQYARPNVFPELGSTPIYEAPPFGATREEWSQEKWSRLSAYPGQYIGCMLREVLYRHYDIVSHYFPFSPDNTFYKPAYRPMDSSPASLVFRATGIDLVAFTSTAKWPELWSPLALAFAKIVTFYGLLGIGIREAAKRTPVLATAIPLTVIAWSFSIVTLVSLEPRYLLPFSPFFYLAYALAIVAIFREGYTKIVSYLGRAIKMARRQV